MLGKAPSLGLYLVHNVHIRDACVYKRVCISYFTLKPWFGFGCKVKPLLVGVQYLILNMHPKP